MITPGGASKKSASAPRKGTPYDRSSPPPEGVRNQELEQKAPGYLGQVQQAPHNGVGATAIWLPVVPSRVTQAFVFFCWQSRELAADIRDIDVMEPKRSGRSRLQPTRAGLLWHGKGLDDKRARKIVNAR